MPAPSPTTTGNTLPSNQPEVAFASQQTLSQAALHGVGLSAVHFYGGNDSFIGRSMEDNEHRVLVAHPGEEGRGRRNEQVGAGSDAEAALTDSLEQMRTLETTRTKSLASIEMTDTAHVDFTALEHYSPKVAPGREVHSVPDYLTDMVTDYANGKQTYEKTVAQEGWQSDIRGIIDEYIAKTPAGQQLAAQLRIQSLSHLTPEQAVKLSTALVQDVSKYSSADVGVGDGQSRADQTTTPELLREGMASKGNPEWKGNGVCRNIASNVKAVFEALKATQDELSMLRNTYAIYGGGAAGAGYRDARDNPHLVKAADRTGHAWNTFVTVGRDGSAVATIIDATWALGTDLATATEHLDRTQVRSAAQIYRLFEQSENKDEAFLSLTDYTQRLIQRTATDKTISPKGRDDLREYAASQYMRAASQMPEIPDGYQLPGDIVGIAYRMRGRLDKHEVETLYTLDTASGSLEQERLKLIIVGYDTGRDVPTGSVSAENLTFKDDDLQELAYEAVGQDRVMALAERDGSFRGRLRQLHPETLPAFNPYANLADSRELSNLVSGEGIHHSDPASIMRAMRQQINRIAGNQATAEAIVTGRSDYELAKNFRAIKQALRQNKSNS